MFVEPEAALSNVWTTISGIPDPPQHVIDSYVTATVLTIR